MTVPVDFGPRWAEIHNIADSPEKYRGLQTVLRNGHSRSLHDE